jgi:integrase/recombinase XerD
MTKELQRIDTETVYDQLLSVDDSYGDHAKEFVAFLRDNGHGLNQEGFCAYADSLEKTRPNGRKLAVGSYNVKLAASKKRIRDLFERTPDALDVVKRMELERALAERKSKRISREQKKIHIGQVITFEEIRILTASLQTQSKVPGGAGIALVVEFLASTGARISEMLNLTLGDVKKIRGKMQYRARLVGKGQKERPVKISADLYDRIRAHYGGSGYLFDHGGKPYTRHYISNAIKQGGREYIDREISAHTLRHSFATEKIRKTGKIKGTSEYLGHSSTSTTLDMYVHEELSDEDLDL